MEPHVQNLVANSNPLLACVRMKENCFCFQSLDSSGGETYFLCSTLEINLYYLVLLSLGELNVEEIQQKDLPSNQRPLESDFLRLLESLRGIPSVLTWQQPNTGLKLVNYG